MQASTEMLSKKYRLGGPQVDRDMKWIMSDNELLKPPQREDLSIDRNSEKKVFEGELARLNRDNASLKDQLQRALTELRAYQIKYPPVHSKADTIQTENLPPWTTSEEIMSPIFDAYDARIGELEHIIETQTSQLESFHEKVQSVMEENENLRAAQLENLKIREARNPTFGSLNDDLYAELNERIEILMSENSVMVDQKSLLSNELEAHQEELAMRTKEVAELTEVLTSNMKDLKASKQHIAQAESDRDEAAQKALSYSDAMGKAEIAAEELREKLSSTQMKMTSLEMELKEARVSVRSLVSKADADAQTNMRRMRAAEERVADLHAQLLQKTEELDMTQDAIRKLRREYKSTQQDAEGMLQVMQGLERQVTAYAEREKEVERMANENKAKMEEVLIARDQAVCREKQSILEVERLLGERKVMAQERHVLMEKVAEEARTRASAQVLAIEETLERMVSQNTELRAECEKSHRDSQSAKDLLQAAQRATEEERRNVHKSVETMAKELALAVKGMENETARRTRLQMENTEHRLMIDKLRSQLDNVKTSNEQRDKIHESEISTVRTSARDANKVSVEKTRALALKVKEFNEFKVDMESRLLATDQARDMDTAVLRQKAAEADRLVKELEHAVASEEKRNALLIDKLKETYATTTNALERQLYDNNEAFKRLESFAKDLETSLHELKTERSAMARSLEEAKATIFHLQDDLEDAQGTVAALTAQLAASFEARDVASLKSISAVLGAKFQKVPSLRSRAAELAEEIVEDSYDNVRYDYGDSAGGQNRFALAVGDTYVD